jgi:uncharacterized membrane protein YgaE (UPF0421/DUF939 family)
VTSRGRSRGKSDGKFPVSRQELSEYLGEVLTISFEKIHLRNTRNVERASLMRIVIAACEAQASILKDVDLDELKLRLDKLEEAVK